MRRLLLGLTAIAFCVLGAILWAQEIEDFLGKTLVRSGIVLAVLWLAYPQLADSFRRIPPALLVAGSIGGMIVIVRPKAILAVAPILLAIAALQFVSWVFKPLPRKK